MPFTTTGAFERLHNWEEDRLNGIEIVTDHHDAEDDNFADGLSQTLLKDGRAPMEGTLNMEVFRLPAFQTVLINKMPLPRHN